MQVTKYLLIKVSSTRKLISLKCKNKTALPPRICQPKLHHPTNTITIALCSLTCVFKFLQGHNCFCLLGLVIEQRLYQLST